MPVGRFAPSPTGRLHLGNLRTALVAWLAARSDRSRFVLRFEDLDTAAVRAEHYRSQPADLEAMGLDWDGRPIRQSERTGRYQEILDRLVADDAVYPCFCSRREIREAAQAPNSTGPGPPAGAEPGAGPRPGPGLETQPGPVPGYQGHRYPGTCRDLSSADRAERALTRDPALRLRAEGEVRVVDDRVAGPSRFRSDDFVVQRNDGTPAYHLVVVVDDAEAGVELVVRADDLLESAARQILLHERLGLAVPAYAHVPLVLGPDGDRLAKRHGGVDLDDRAAAGQGPAQVVGYLASTLGLCSGEEVAAGVQPSQLIDRFDLGAMPRQPLVLPEDLLRTEADTRSPHPRNSSDTV